MKRNLGRLAVVAALLGLGGCINITTPLDTNLHDTRLGALRGEASSHSVLLLFAWGDAGTHAAAEDGGLEIVRHADQRLFAVGPFIYTRYTTVVYGD